MDGGPVNTMNLRPVALLLALAACSFAQGIVSSLSDPRRPSYEQLSVWRREFLRQRLLNVAEVRTGEAEFLVGIGPGKRRVLV